MKFLHVIVKHTAHKIPSKFAFQALFVVPFIFYFMNCYSHSGFENGWFSRSEVADSGNFRILHVSKTGKDTNSGDAANPFLTISQAAHHAFPGDLILIGEGVYRESINPPRGGSSDTSNITYKAVSGARVIVKGSKIIDNWVKQSSGIWKTVLHDSLFGEYHPYRTHISGDYLKYGQWHHTGEIYLNEQPLSEKSSITEVVSTEKSWFVIASETAVSIYANFGRTDPSDALVEINKEETLFYPDTPGKNYITIDSLVFSQAATNWQSPVGEQKAMIGSNGGHHWTIKNCTLTHSRSTGISIGNPSDSVDISDIQKVGHHLIENNVISYCGEAGICGRLHSSNSRIINNLIENINYKLEFGGYETAAIKFHASIEIDISNNLIRGVNGVANAGPGHGIWIDYGNQGTTISQNIVHHISGCALFLECNSGPFLVHNNIFAGNIQNAGSSNAIFLNNMFIHSNFTFFNSPKRLHWIYGPDNFTRVKTDIPSVVSNIRFYSNIFFYKGLEIDGFEDLYSDGNIFYSPGWENNWGDSLSIYLKEAPHVKYTSCSSNFQLSFYLPKGATRSMNSQLLEGVRADIHSLKDDFNPQGFYLMDFDISGYPRNYENEIAGPFNQLKKGTNHYNRSEKNQSFDLDLKNSKTFSSEEYMEKLMSVYSKTAKRSFIIGDTVEGGMIYHLEKSKNGGGTAYIVALENIGNLPWSDAFYDSTDLTDVQTNQDARNRNFHTSAITACSSYTRDGFKQWTLPTIGELKLLFDVTGRINISIKEKKLTNSDPIVIRTSYWSSSEDNSQLAWILNMGCGTQSLVNKSSILIVRPVRKISF